MATTGNYSANIALPVAPNTDDPVMFQELLQVYNAIRTLAVALDNYTGDGYSLLDAMLNAAQLGGQVVALQREVRELQEQLATANQPTTWSQPGELGSTTPNTAIVTDLTASGVTKLAGTTTTTFGTNGAAASGRVNLPGAATDAATTQALANALRNLAINFGLGV